jgi:hypothetical protein
LSRRIASALPWPAICSENAKDCFVTVNYISALAISENCEMEASLKDSKKI